MLWQCSERISRSLYWSERIMRTCPISSGIFPLVRSVRFAGYRHPGSLDDRGRTSLLAPNHRCVIHRHPKGHVSHDFRLAAWTTNLILKVIYVLMHWVAKCVIIRRRWRGLRVFRRDNHTRWQDNFSNVGLSCYDGWSLVWVDNRGDTRVDLFQMNVQNWVVQVGGNKFEGKVLREVCGWSIASKEPTDFLRWRWVILNLKWEIMVVSVLKLLGVFL